MTLPASVLSPPPNIPNGFSDSDSDSESDSPADSFSDHDAPTSLRLSDNFAAIKLPIKSLLAVRKKRATLL